MTLCQTNPSFGRTGSDTPILFMINQLYSFIRKREKGQGVEEREEREDKGKKGRVREEGGTSRRKEDATSEFRKT